MDAQAMTVWRILPRFTRGWQRINVLAVLDRPMTSKQVTQAIRRTFVHNKIFHRSVIRILNALVSEGVVTVKAHTQPRIFKLTPLGEQLKVILTQNDPRVSNAWLRR